MIIIDCSQICIAAMVDQVTHQKTNLVVNEAFLKHIALNSIRSHVMRFKKEYGPEVVLAFDSPNSWRRNVFQHYKEHRKKDRAKSLIDWRMIYNIIDQLKVESKNLPYKVMVVDSCEADDIIAVLCKETTTKTVIVSSDKDFLQLHENKNVKQYSPRHKSLLQPPAESPRAYLKELIIRGDESDGIPNVLSKDNVIVTGKRQTPMTKNRFDKLWNTPVERLEESIKRNYKRNEVLISFDYIPIDVQERIKEHFANAKAATRQTMLHYFMEQKLKKLIDVADEF